MPKRTPADKAAASGRWHRSQFQAAYEGGTLDAPVDVSFDWLRAVLGLAAQQDVAQAAPLYDKAARLIAGLAQEITELVARST